MKIYDITRGGENKLSRHAIGRALSPQGRYTVTEQERIDMLNKAESDIQTAITMEGKAYRIKADALLTIRENALWNVGGFEDYHAYCRKRWQISAKRADQICASGAVLRTVADLDNGSLCVNESVLRPLVVCTTDECRSFWSRMLGIAGSDGRITSRQVSKLISDAKGPIAKPQKAGAVVKPLAVIKAFDRAERAISELKLIVPDDADRFAAFKRVASFLRFELGKVKSAA